MIDDIRRMIKKIKRELNKLTKPELIEKLEDCEQQVKDLKKKITLHKCIASIGIIFTVIITFFAFITPYVIPMIFDSDVNVISGGKDITPISNNIDTMRGNWSIIMKNDGYGDATDIRLTIKFQEGIDILDDTIEYSSTPEPNNNKDDDEKNIFERTWSKIKAGGKVEVKFDAIVIGSAIVHKKVPKYVQVETKEDGVVYRYPPI